MISKNKIKLLSSLHHKKYRDEYGKFLAEGDKIITELINSGDSMLQLEELLATEEFFSTLPAGIMPPDLQITLINSTELKKISALSTPNNAALLIKIPKYQFNRELIKDKLVLAFDSIRDPGNLGTIIRTCDWFGINDIICSKESVDVFNPKTVQSTMGAIARVRVHYMELKNQLIKLKADYGTPIIGTMLDGEELGKKGLPENGVILFGNESRGISEELQGIVNYRVRIPSFGIGPGLTESLNLASAVSIICWEVRSKNNITRNEN